MKTEKDKYCLLKENMMDGYAYHQIVRDSSGTPVDYIFLDVNPAFEAITAWSGAIFLARRLLRCCLE